MKTRLKIGLVLITALILTLSTFSSATAAVDIAYACGVVGGTWSGSSDVTGTCIFDKGHVLTQTHCPGFDQLRFKFINNALQGTTCVNFSGGMRREGYCKLVSLPETGFLGGTITATVKGAPSNLKLKAGGQTYTLPLVPGSVTNSGEGTYTAQFYTVDPVIGQPLVPAGDYTARCHGSNGSKDGGSNNTITIGY